MGQESRSDGDLSFAELRAMYDAQCACTDEWVAKYEAEKEKKASATLLNRIAELKSQLAEVNQRLASANQTRIVAGIALPEIGRGPTMETGPDGRCDAPLSANRRPNHLEICQAVARGWCSPNNEHKEMDEALAFAIAVQVEALLARSEGAAK